MFHARTSRPSPTPRLSLVLLGAALAFALTVALALAGSPAARAAAGRGHPHATSPSSTACPWVNSQAPTSAKVADVIDHMSLDDEITMVEGHGTAPPNPYVFYMPGIPDLCIPQLGEEDGPAGVADQLTGVTQLPAGVGLAATFNPSLARQYGQVIGSEELGKGAAVNLGPTINIDRDPRWGRSFETFTEDPFLNTALAVSEIKGVQSTGEMSQVKHFAAYNQETNRNTPQDDVIVSTRVLREIYEPAFQASVENANVASLMCSYSTINGDYACQDNNLLNTTLKQLWGFQGFVTSDYAALHDVSGALDGTDQEQPFADSFGTTLEQDVQNGTIPRAVLNTMVSRMLTEMFRFGIIDHPPAGTPTDPVTSPAHVAVATSVADQSATLLKNDSQTLPLSAAHSGTVAVIGPSASASPTYGGGGSAYVIPSQTVTPLQGLEAAAGHGTHLTYQQGLPTDGSLPAIPSTALSPAYAPTPFGGSYTGTLTAPETGTYVLAIDNPCGCYTPTYLSLNGQQILDDPSTPPEHVYSVAVSLVQGSDLHAEHQRRLGRAAVGHALGAPARDRRRRGVGQERRHGDRGRLRRHRVRGHRPPVAQPALGAGRAHLGGRGRQPAHGGRRQRRRAGGDAVALAGLRGARRLVSGRGERHLAGTGPVRARQSGWPPAGDLPHDAVTGPGRQPRAVPGRGRQGPVFRGARRGLPLV